MTDCVYVHIDDDGHCPWCGQIGADPEPRAGVSPPDDTLRKQFMDAIDATDEAA